MRAHVIALTLLVAILPWALAQAARAGSGASPGAAPGEAPCLSWVNPRVSPRAVLLCVHGLGLYSGSYEAFGKRMARLNIATYALDVRGFGSWMKNQGHTQVDFNDCIADVQKALETLHKANPGRPVFLLGESMGGAIALRVTALYPDLVSGLISSVPAGDRFKEKRTAASVALHALKGFNKPFDAGEKVVDQATKNPELRSKWEGDPLDKMDLSPHELLQFDRFMKENHDAAKTIVSTPVLIVQGCQDQLVRPKGTIELFDELKTPDKEIVLVANAEHLIFEEGQFTDDVVSTVHQWISRRISGSANTSALSDVKLLEGKQNLAEGQYDKAEKIFQEAVRIEPESSEAHLLLGQAYARTRDYARAREHLLRAMKLGKGNEHTKDANKSMLGLPAPDQHAISASGTDVDTLLTGLAPTGGSAGRSLRRRPIVLYFYASWCEPCQDLDAAIERAKQRYGRTVSFIKIDVDDPDNRPLLDKFSVGPVPTLVFLRANRQVASYAIGYSDGGSGLWAGLRKIAYRR